MDRLTFEQSLSTRSFHLRFSPKWIPKYFVVWTRLTWFLPILIGKSHPKLDNLKVVVKNIYSVLVTFKLNLFARSQSLTRVRSLFTLAYSSAVDTEDAYIVVSSAYMCALVWGRHPGRSLIYIKNNKGPKIEPCRTPQLQLGLGYTALYYTLLLPIW